MIKWFKKLIPNDEDAVMAVVLVPVVLLIIGLVIYSGNSLDTCEAQLKEIKIRQEYERVLIDKENQIQYLLNKTCKEVE